MLRDKFKHTSILTLARRALNKHDSADSKMMKGNILDFGSRHSSFHKRNDLVLRSLPLAPAWVLDIGSNLGDTSTFLANHGYYALGVESSHEEWSQSNKNSVAGAAFMKAEVSPMFIESGKEWDAICLLSVLHRVYAFQGLNVMIKLLTACSNRTKNIILEGSTRHARYTDKGQDEPNFIDLNVASAEEWHRYIFNTALDDCWNIVKIEYLKCSKKEPYRIFFHVQKL